MADLGWRFPLAFLRVGLIGKSAQKYFVTGINYIMGKIPAEVKQAIRRTETIGKIIKSR